MARSSVCPVWFPSAEQHKTSGCNSPYWTWFPCSILLCGCVYFLWKTSKSSTNFWNCRNSARCRLLQETCQTEKEKKIRCVVLDRRSVCFIVSWWSWYSTPIFVISSVLFNFSHCVYVACMQQKNWQKIPTD